MGDKNYDREKVITINDTPIALTFTGAETPTAEAPLAVGADGEAAITVLADADESGGVDVQDLYTISIVPVIDTLAPGKQRLIISVTPVRGDATLGSTRSLIVDHPETMDAWQSSAGRARQA
ncbi:hypothetical protein LCGC14_0274180 [marine sediment metagenome]|uniref:Uncharacterized protein n=2 Tax=root TaxID=1 RepID=A0A9C9ND96_9HYPH|nr:hypothetical protein [Aurantimonas coralicida]